MLHNVAGYLSFLALTTTALASERTGYGTLKYREEFSRELSGLRGVGEVLQSAPSWNSSLVSCGSWSGAVISWHCNCSERLYIDARYTRYLLGDLVNLKNVHLASTVCYQRSPVGNLGIVIHTMGNAGAPLDLVDKTV